MYQPFDAAISVSPFEDSDRLERGIHGYFPFRRICRRCGTPMVGRTSYDAFAQHDCCDVMDFDLFEEDYANEMEELVDLADQLAEEGMEDIDQAIPALASTAARALARPVLRRTGGQLSSALRQRLGRSTGLAARTLMRRRGPPALRALPRIVRSIRRNALRHRVPVHALPAAVRRIAASVSARPNLISRLTQPFGGGGRYVPDPLVSRICSEARAYTDSLRQGAQIKRKVEQWMHRVIRDELMPSLGRLNNRDLDILIGCFYGLESALGKTPGSLRRLREAIAHRLGVRT